MALLTKRASENLLRRLWETGGLTPDMEEDLQRLRDDFDEREGILRKYGEVYDGEDRDEYDWTETRTASEAQYNNWEDKYKEMKQRYIDRFFGGNRIDDKDTTVLDDTSNEEPMDVTVEDLLYRKEA